MFIHVVEAEVMAMFVCLVGGVGGGVQPCSSGGSNGYVCVPGWWCLCSTM